MRNPFGGSNQGRGMGTGRKLEEVRVTGGNRTVIVTRGSGQSVESFNNDVRRAEKDSGGNRS